MPRSLNAFGVFVLLAFAACGGDEPPPAASATATTTGTASSTTTSPPQTTLTTAATTASPAPQPDVDLPNGVAATVDDPADLAAIAAGDLTVLAPPGSSFTDASTLGTPRDPLDQITLTWVQGIPPEGRAGLIVWQQFDDPDAWRAVFAFTDGPRKGVFGIRVSEGNLTGDGLPDLLSLEDVGGSGACGTYRVIASAKGDASEIFHRDVCDTQIVIARGNLRVREALFEPDDPHCCPSAFRTSTLRWDGSAWHEVSSEVSPSG